MDVFFTRLFDLYNDRNDNKDDHNAGSHANDRPTGVGQLIQQAGFPLFVSTLTQPYSYCVPRIGRVAIFRVAEKMVMRVAVAQEHTIHGGQTGPAVLAFSIAVHH